jgi:threonylcarbamoyladenosine tRNA methylthiotransferase MtaB
MKTISFLTLGCRANQSESNEYLQSMLEAGWEVLDSDNNLSEVYVVNTCTVTNEAERQSRQLIRKIKKNNPNSKIIVTGCSSRYLENNKEIKEKVSLFIPNLEKDKFIERLYSYLGIEKDLNSVSLIPPVEKSDTTRLNIKIADGCNWACSFCIIPRVRGKLRSLTEEDVLNKVKLAEKLGYKEIVLTAIQLGGYGKDFGKRGLETLIPLLLKETSIPRIRLSSIEPTDVTDKLIEELSKSERICNHFHIPVQSCSNNVLNLMKRKYTIQEYKNRIDTLRKYIPNVTITTDIMVGFPQETDDDFKESVYYCEEICFDKLHIFPYSDRYGTVASKMPNKIPSDIIKERKKILIELDKKLHKKSFDKALNKTKEVIVEEIKNREDICQGTSKDYFKVQFYSAKSMKNDIVNVKITEYDLENFILKGEII